MPKRISITIGNKILFFAFTHLACLAAGMAWMGSVS